MVSSGSYSIVGYTPGPSDAAPHGRQEVVGGDYFAAMQIPLVEGRFFNDGDTADSPPVVVVDQYMAKKYFANRSALGQQIQRGGPDSPRMTIVGVVGHDQQHRSRPAGDEGAHLSSGDAAAAGGDGARAEDRRSIRRRWSAQVRARRAVDRSRAADRRRPDDGAVGVAIARAAADADRAARAVRRRWRWCSRRSASTACWRSASPSASASSASARRSAPTAVDSLARA